MNNVLLARQSNGETDTTETLFVYHYLNNKRVLHCVTLKIITRYMSSFSAKLNDIHTIFHCYQLAFCLNKTMSNHETTMGATRHRRGKGGGKYPGNVQVGYAPWNAHFLALWYTFFSLPEAVPDPEICKNTFVAGFHPGPRWRISRRFPRPPVSRGGDTPFLDPSPFVPRPRTFGARHSTPRFLPLPAKNPGGTHGDNRRPVDTAHNSTIQSLPLARQQHFRLRPCELDLNFTVSFVCCCCILSCCSFFVLSTSFVIAVNICYSKTSIMYRDYYYTNVNTPSQTDQLYNDFTCELWWACCLVIWRFKV